MPQGTAIPKMGILDQFKLDGKTALVTGSASGLGAAIAVALAEAGASVACHGNRRPAEQTSERIRSLGRASQSFAADLGATDGAEKLYESVTAEMGAPGIPVNNAGTIYREAAEDYDTQAWMQVLQVNLNSVFRLCQLAGSSMLERREGKIINIASLLSFQGGIRVPAYAASKGGVAQLTKALANEWAGRDWSGHGRGEADDGTIQIDIGKMQRARLVERVDQECFPQLRGGHAGIAYRISH